MTAIVLAAGAGKRFGANKLLADFAGRPVLTCVLREVKKCGFKKILVPFFDGEVEKIVLQENCIPIFNPKAEFGQSESIKLGVQFAAKTDAMAFFVGDNPKIDANFVKKMIAEFSRTQKIVVPVCKGVMGNPVIFPARCREPLLALKGDVGGKKVVAAFADEVLQIPAPPSVLFDIDRKSDIS